jgi:hypothetical protein
VHFFLSLPVLVCFRSRGLAEEETCGQRDPGTVKRTRSRVLPADKSALPFARRFDEEPGLLPDLTVHDAIASRLSWQARQVARSSAQSCVASNSLPSRC